MKKKIALGLIAVVAVAGGVVAMSAYEAHVINVTAHIENALKVTPATGELTFGTVFPQEYLEKSIWITTSESFCAGDQRRVLSIDYKIVQKPKPIWPIPEICDYYPGEFTIEDMRTYCHNTPEDLTCCYPSLCPYLSKTPKYEDPKPYTDYGVTAFHDPSDPSSIAIGTIHKDNDLLDEWIIDLDVPCFEGMCAQDWTHLGWELPAELEDHDFGCDLWIEVTDIY
jgi:hypothetical protein